MKGISAVLRKLTFDDLRQWAGEKVLDRGKSYVKRVQQLSRTPENDLVAWVSGSERYATSVRLDQRSGLEHFCTCPYDWGPCKHAVAVILAGAARVRTRETIPVLDEDDDLNFALILDADEEEEWLEDDETVHASAPRRTKAQAELEKMLGHKSQEELLALLTDLCKRLPEVRQRVLETEQLASGQVDKLVSELRSEIRNLTSEPVWYNPWRGEGSLPDYSHVEEQLKALVDKAHTDAVLELGAELWTRGNAQVEQSDDEGETAMSIAACMETVMSALPQSSLSQSEQLLWVIDRALEDEFSMLEAAETVLKHRSYKRADWREVADSLERRLQAMPRPRAATFSASYRRERLLFQLLDAYGRAGWKERIIPRLEAEADVCRCYSRLVDTLMAAGERDRARHWCMHGYAQTVDNAPGIAGLLRDRLRELAQKERQHDLVAAYRAQDFFERPSSSSYCELRKAAEKAKCWPPVRTASLQFLESGQHPTAGSKKAGKSDWPLPSPEVEPPAMKERDVSQRFPDLVTLIDVAILEKRLDETVELYQRLCKTKRWGWETDRTVANAVMNTHPEIALGIWQRIVDSLISQVKPKAYEEAAIYLRRMEKVYRRTQRLAEWRGLLGSLRKKHKAKRRLIGVLDNLSKKKIVA